MTGFNRFLYENEDSGWLYNRTEGMPDQEYLVYTHLVSDRSNYTGFSLYKEPIKGFDRLDIRGFIKNPLRNPLVILSNKIFILERDDIKQKRLKDQQKIN